MNGPKSWTGFPTERYHQKLGKPHQPQKNWRPQQNPPGREDFWTAERNPIPLRWFEKGLIPWKSWASSVVTMMTNAIVAIHPERRYRVRMGIDAFEMYKRWVSEENYQIEIMDFLPGEEGESNPLLFRFRATCLREIKGRNWSPSISSISHLMQTKDAIRHSLPSLSMPRWTRKLKSKSNWRFESRRTYRPAVPVVSVNTTILRSASIFQPTSSGQKAQHKNRATAMKMLKARL